MHRKDCDNIIIRIVQLTYRSIGLFSAKYGLQIEKRQGNNEIYGNFIEFTFGIILFFIVNLRHICLI